MNDELSKIMEASTFGVCEGSWVYAKVAGEPKLNDCFMLSRDDEEMTAVFEESKASSFEIIERNKDLRKLIEIKVSAPFYAVGFLAAITNAISSKGCNNLIISTYSKDYVLVTEAQFDQAKQALLELGLKEQ